jgi:hypothetical protein
MLTCLKEVDIARRLGPRPLNLESRESATTRHLSNLGPTRTV